MGLRDRLSSFVFAIVNLVYFCAGLAVLVVGALGLSNASNIIDLLLFVPKINELSLIIDLVGLAVGPAIYLTVMGSVVIILSFIGCGGAFKKSKLIIYIFGMTTLLMMLFNIALIMFYAIDPYFIEGNVGSGMTRQLQENFESVKIDAGGVIIYPNDTTALAWNNMQLEESCCGVINFTDYKNFGWNYTDLTSSVSSSNVPPSCCLLISPGVPPTRTSDFVNLTACLNTAPSSNPRYVNARGCISYAMQEVTRYNFIYTVVAAAFTGLQAIILCMTLRQGMKDNHVGV